MHEGIEPSTGQPCNLSTCGQGPKLPLPINAWLKHALADGNCLAAFKEVVAKQTYNLQALKHHIFSYVCHVKIVRV